MLNKISSHIQEHHKKYLFGLVSWGVFLKLAIFIATGLGVVAISATNADIQTWCTLTGQYLTWTTLTGWYYTWEYFTWEYSTWEYFTGEYLTWWVLSWDELTGQYLTWGYYTWAYLTGGYFTGGYTTWEYLTWGYLTWGILTGCITIITDTQKPSITGITLSLKGVTSNYIGSGGTAKIVFSADEELSGNVITIRWSPANFVSKSGSLYTYLQTLSTSNTEWPLAFSIAYSDIAGNTGAYTSTGPIIFDKTAPIISWFTLSGDDIVWFTLGRTSNENTKYDMNYTISWAVTKNITWTNYSTNFSQLITGITIGNVLTFQIRVSDVIGNKTQLTGTIGISISGQVNFTYAIVWTTIATTNTTGSAVASTGSLALFAQTLQNEINKFNDCRNAIQYQDIDINILDKNMVIHMPTFDQEYMKQIVNAFTLFMISKLKEDVNLTSTDLNFITNKFNNFLVILKLLRENNNVCQQNLSNYHIMQFQETLGEFGIVI